MTKTPVSRILTLILLLSLLRKEEQKSASGQAERVAET